MSKQKTTEQDKHNETINMKVVNDGEKKVEIDKASSSVVSTYEPPMVKSTENLPPQCSF